MFKIGSYVVYRAEGVCTVSDVRSESFGTIGKDEKYYILTPLRDERSQVFVPVNNAELLGYMRTPITADEINSMIDVLVDCRLEWICESRVRGASFKEILASGDVKRIIVLINTLADKLDEIAEMGKKPGSTETSAYEKAVRSLYQELTVNTDISSEDDVLRALRGEIRLSAKCNVVCEA